MLSLIELKEIAELKRLSLKNAERDYLQDLILFSIYSKLSKELVFKGGTCLYKLYRLNRFSEDLDFTANSILNIQKISDNIILNLSLLNIKCKLKEIKEYNNEINVRFLINGPLYNGSKESQCFIPLNISKKEKIFSEPNKLSLLSSYKEIPIFEVFAMQEREILAEKFRAICTRMKARDIYDFWFLLKFKKIDFNIQLINHKLSLYKLKFDKDFLINRVNIMKNLFLSDLRGLIFGELPDFNIIEKEISEILKKI